VQGNFSPAIGNVSAISFGLLASPAAGVDSSDVRRNAMPAKRNVQSVTDFLRGIDSIPGLPRTAKQFTAHDPQEATIIHRILLLTKRRLGIYFATRRSMREGDPPP
jgi:hypothetical protein